MRIKFLEITLMSLLGLILITCQEEYPLEENQIIFNSETETEVYSITQYSDGTVEYLETLIEIIEIMVDKGLLDNHIAHALESQIENVIKSIKKGNIDASIGQLKAFIHVIEALINNGKIHIDDGQTLINTAESVIILSEGGFIDPRDGYEYTVVLLGNQLWMAENLKTIKYLNGDFIGTTIPLTKDITFENAPKYQWVYEGNENNVNTYGRLYTWYVVADDRKICPQGWHVPSNDEWTILEDYLIENGYGYEGDGNDIAKSLAANTNWFYYDLSGTPGNDLITNNSSGFSALPGGWRQHTGEFYSIGSYGSWWSSTEDYSNSAWFRKILSTNVDLITYSNNKRQGFSVRCIRD